MFGYIWRKFLTAAATVLVLATLTFFLVKLIPGNPCLSETVPEVIQQKQREFYGLDKPVYVQYFIYMSNLLKGDLGFSLKKTGKSVVSIIAETFPVSAKLGLLSFIFSQLIGMLFGILCAQYKNRWPDYLLMIVAILGIALPAMILGPSATSSGSS